MDEGCVCVCVGGSSLGGRDRSLGPALLRRQQQVEPCPTPLPRPPSDCSSPWPAGSLLPNSSLSWKWKDGNSSAWVVWKADKVVSPAAGSSDLSSPPLLSQPCLATVTCVRGCSPGRRGVGTPSLLHRPNFSDLQRDAAGRFFPTSATLSPLSQFFLPHIVHTCPLPGLVGTEDAEVKKIRDLRWGDRQLRHGVIRKVHLSRALGAEQVWGRPYQLRCGEQSFPP